MKKVLGLLLILILNFAAVEAVAPRAAHPGQHKVTGASKQISTAEAAVQEPMVSFKQSDCRKIEGTPTIVVCVEGDAGSGELDLNTLRGLKGVTSNLITKYKAKSAKAAISRKAVTSACGAMPDAMNDPMGYAAWMMCSAMGAMTPPDPEAVCMQTHGMSCAAYAAMMSNMNTTPPPPDPEAVCMQTHGMSCAAYAAMMSNMNTTPPPPDPEAVCMQTHGMSCAAYAAMMSNMNTTPPPPDPEAVCMQTYGMSCAAYAQLMTGMH